MSAEAGTILDSIIKDLKGTEENPRTDVTVPVSYTLRSNIPGFRMVRMGDIDLNLLTTKIFVAPTTPISPRDIDALNRFLGSLTSVPTSRDPKLFSVLALMGLNNLEFGHLQFREDAGNYGRQLATTLDVIPALQKFLPKKIEPNHSAKGKLSHEITIYAFPTPYLAKTVGEYVLGYQDTHYPGQTHKYSYDIDSLLLSGLQPYYFADAMQGRYPKPAERIQEQ